MSIVKTVKPYERRIRSANQDELQSYLQVLCGQPFLLFRFSYGQELSLHLGAPQPYSSPKLKHLVQGSYIVGTRASSWQLSPLDPREGSAASDVYFMMHPFPDGNPVESGAEIARIFVSKSKVGFHLQLGFTDGKAFHITPEPSLDPIDLENDIADWEVFMPDGGCLQVGPGLTWSYLRANVL